MKFLLMISMSLSILIIMLKHPMSLGFILLNQTLIITLMINNLNPNFWFSYILFLIMIGGMLILFIYMTSIASNEKFYFSNMLVLFLIMSMIIIFMMIIIDNFYMNNNMFNYETIKMNSLVTFKFSMNKMFNYPNMYIYYLTIIYLLMTLIAVVKISSINLGSLRQK